jgi:hypothetical protein
MERIHRGDEISRELFCVCWRILSPRKRGSHNFSHRYPALAPQEEKARGSDGATLFGSSGPNPILFPILTPPSPRKKKKRGAQTGLHSLGPPDLIRFYYQS